MVPDAERDAVPLDTANSVEAALIGPGVYCDVVGYWPGAQDETDTQSAYIARINPMPKFVVSHALHDHLQ